MEKIFGISCVGIAAGIILGILSIFISVLEPVAAVVFIVSCAVMIITFFIDAAIYLLS